MTLGAHAASPDDSQVWVVSKDWSTKSYNISNLKKIVFHESELSLIDRNDNESKESYSNLFKLMFNGDPTGVQNVTTERLSVVYRELLMLTDGQKVVPMLHSMTLAETCMVLSKHGTADR